VTAETRLRHLLQEAADRLRAVQAAEDIDDARLQVELLFGLASGRDRAAVIAAGNDAPEPEAAERFRALLDRRAQHEPLAYILGHREFYGLTFAVGPGCLIPRPETEGVVEAALAAIAEHPRARRLVRVADIGTGSGAIALAIARHSPQAKVFATDVSTEALQWAGRNMRTFGLQDRVVLLAGHLLDPLTEPIDVLCANLPYISTEEVDRLPSQIRDREPRIAVDGGKTGIELIEELAAALPARLAGDTAAAIFEVGAGQIGWAEELIVTAFEGAGRSDLDVRQHRDLYGIRRVLEVRTGYGEAE
jgi:release factor glutamine methyltransferase